MKLEMAKNSLFAVLLRSPWWISFLISAGLFFLVRLALPPVYAAFSTLPFVVIGCVAAWRQLRAPSAAKIAARLEAIRAMSWEDFSLELADAFRSDGFEVIPATVKAADLEMIKARRVVLVGCKRWKAARTGIEPLRELLAAMRAREAHECLYVAAGEISDTARAFATEQNIRLMLDADLARLLPRAGKAARMSA